MTQLTKLRELIGAIKDKASQSRAALLSKPNTLSLHLAVLRATTHAPSTPPDEKHLNYLLSLGDSSRATASALVESLIHRLRRTGDANVALKCLLTIHHIIRRGPFILQDQIWTFPAGAGGRNNLKLSAFRDGATTSTWVLSTWVRWYARYLETILITSKVLGFFISSTSSSAAERDNQRDRISSYSNLDLIKDTESLVGILQDICKIPDLPIDSGNKILHEITGFTAADIQSAVNEAVLRMAEIRERLNFFNFGECVELVCVMKRLEECKERLTGLFTIKRSSIEALWCLVGELQVKVKVKGNEKDEDGRKMMKGCVSARFGDGSVKFVDPSHFSSSRLDINKVAFAIR